MNVAVINIRDIFKYFTKIFISLLIIYVASKFITKSEYSLKNTILYKVDSNFLKQCFNSSIPLFRTIEDKEANKVKLVSLMNFEIATLNTNMMQLTEENSNVTDRVHKNESQVASSSPQVQIPKEAKTEEVTDRNFISGSTNHYGTTKIDNQSDYTITEDMFKTDIELTNKKDVIIYHTHTCESYTPCDTYNYTMTGNYRTTDSNYNIIRVGSELTTHLTKKGFNVIHDGTYHDYPSYSGSYSRSLDTAKRLLQDSKAEIVIDLHRDAVGNGDTYGPTVMVNGERVAQLMFVIGTDGGGLEHPDWVKNLNIAVQIQEKANEMYPGLFRPMIIRNSRYNQHVANGASIIEVGATANTLGECLLSMQCLANVLEEVFM